MDTPAPHPKTIPHTYLRSFCLVTFLFALWGFANDITNPMVAAFKNILLISNFEGSLVQFAFYGGYCLMAIPAALYIKRHTYKSGIIVGLILYATGCFLFIPAGMAMAFWPFLFAYFVMTCGLSFLETSANPYILAMGDERTATRRLNFAQAFNPIGSITGMFIAQQVILTNLNPMDEAGRRSLAATAPAEFAEVVQNDLSVIIGPYVVLGLVVLVALLVFAIVKLPRTVGEDNNEIGLGPTLKRLSRNRRYVEGVVAQAFYVGAQIMCWTFIIHYAVNELGMSAARAQGYNIAAMAIFVSSRFICTLLLKYVTPGHLLLFLALGGAALVLGAIFLPGMTGLYCLVGVSACMSLMFPTIYGIALEGVGDDAKLGAAGLILAIGGGSLMPPLQGAIIDMDNFGWLSSTRASFAIAFVCFIVIAAYGYRAFAVHRPPSERA